MITINFPKAREIAHTRRRLARDREFAPYDEIIMKKIPGEGMKQAEAARAAIRARYEVIQNQVDACETVEDLKALIEAEGL